MNVVSNSIISLNIANINNINIIATAQDGITAMRYSFLITKIGIKLIELK